MDRWRTIPLAALTSLAISMASSLAQIPQKPTITHFLGIRCLIQTERPQWNRNVGTVVSGSIENLTDGPLELQVEPTLHLVSRASTELSQGFWAAADLLHNVPLGMKKRPVGPDKNAVAIESQQILLKFEAKGDVIRFRIDAQRLLWAKEISSVWPSGSFFSTVKSGDYDLQLVLETDKGRIETPKLDIHVDAERAAFQDEARDIASTMFPNALEKTQNLGCFRSLRRGMSVQEVVHKCGRPDEEVGSGIYIFVWEFADGSTVSIGTANLNTICDVRYTGPTGKTSILLTCK